MITPISTSAPISSPPLQSMSEDQEATMLRLVGSELAESTSRRQERRRRLAPEVTEQLVDDAEASGEEEDTLDILIRRTSEILSASNSILSSTRSSRRAIHRLFALDDSLHSTTASDLRASFERLDKTETELARLAIEVEHFARSGPSSHRRIDSTALLGVKAVDHLGASRSTDSLRASVQAPKVSTEERSTMVDALPDRASRRRPIAIASWEGDPMTPSAASAALLRTLSSSSSSSVSSVLSRPGPTPLGRRIDDSPTPSTPATHTIENDSPRSSTDTSFFFPSSTSTSSDAYGYETSPATTVASTSGDEAGRSSRRSTLVSVSSPLGNGSCASIEEDRRPRTPSPSHRGTRMTGSSSPLRTPTTSGLTMTTHSKSTRGNDSPSSGFASTADDDEEEEAEQEDDPLSDLLPSLRPSHHHRRSSSASSLAPYSESYSVQGAEARVNRETAAHRRESTATAGGGKGHRRTESGAIKKLLEQQQKATALGKTGGTGGNWWGWGGSTTTA